MSVQRCCTAACTATPECAVRRRTKALVGRSYPLAMAGGRCDFECPGYRQEPRPGHLWPEEWRAHERGDHSGCLDCGSATSEARCYECDERLGFVADPRRLYRCQHGECAEAGGAQP